MTLVGRRSPERPGDASADVREITVAGLWRTFRRGWWLVALITLMTVVLAGAALKFRAPVYEAGMTVGPASRDPASAGRLAAELEQYAGLATLGQTPGRFELVSTLDRYLALLTSTRVAERLSDDPSLTAALLPGEWDPASETWQPPDGLSERIKRAIVSFFGFPPAPEPGPATIAERLAGELDVRGTGGIYRLTMTFPDPALGVRLLGAMHEAADGILREEALARVRAQIGEIQALLDEENDPVRRDALERLLEGRYQDEALLGATADYAAEVIDPPAASGWPSSAHPLLVLALAGFVGVVIGLFVIFLREALRGVRN